MSSFSWTDHNEYIFIIILKERIKELLALLKGMGSVCESCGMPMEKKEDFGAQDEENRYCTHCTDENGVLKNREDVRALMIAFYMKMNHSTREEALEFVEEHMAKMPAWK
jgi:predicted sulfurtransferase